MAQEIYQWARNLAVYYIILTALMHIMPDPRYSRYVRSFMGILLILIVTSPLFGLEPDVPLAGRSGPVRR